MLNEESTTTPQFLEQQGLSAMSKSELNALKVMGELFFAFGPSITPSIKESINRLTVPQKACLLTGPVKLLGIDLTDPTQLHDVVSVLNQIGTLLAAEQNIQKK
jgi:hypothetical protein